MHDRDDLDALLDAALRTYSDTPAPVNLEARVLASIKTPVTDVRTAKPSRGWMAWTIAVPAAAAVLFAVLLVSRHRAVSPDMAHYVPPASPAPAADAGTSEVPPSMLGGTAKAGVKVIHMSHASHAFRVKDQSARKESPLPKREVFPTPEPLSPEEQRLVAVAANSPPSVSRTVAESQEHASDPLVIAAIHIPPLSPPDKGGK